MVSSRVFSVAVLLAVVTASIGVATASPATVGAPSDAPTAASPAPLTAITSCTTVSEPGRYVLAADIRNGKIPISTGCIEIESDDVVLNGLGHLVDGVGVSDTSGIHVKNASNVTVRNVRVTDWNRGVFVTGSTDVTVRNVRASRLAIGIEVGDASARLVDNTVVNNLRGVVLSSPHDDQLVGTVARGNNVAAIDAPLSIVNVLGVHLSVGPPRDLDRDDSYDDLTGDGGVGILDAALLPVLAGADAVGLARLPDDQRARLDFDGDGRFGAGDVLAYAGLTPGA